MILHTTVPQELIFPPDHKQFQNIQTIHWQGIPLIVEQQADQYRVVRVLSTNPADFLNEGIGPGQLISISS
ncbi:hypothetical protein J2S13_000638 [Oikeobacillus pervagus]|uniref:Uncharacterized protein n=1 Tax=Oikeobacillus pervagus TaxID=1325931 RepID=A0AAJ1SYT3_9BACI|nr:YlzJ-like family protein [Oikeobacillus pervagus]MDQ0214242.1 hypothetical protein [Oikeobacillus pervagus]